MTYILPMEAGSVHVPTDMDEWRERFPIGKGDDKYVLGITSAWKWGTRETLPEEMPHVLVAKGSRKSWPDSFISRNGIHVVSASVKNVIERFDPDLHQFFPLVLQEKSGGEVEGPWFTMNVTERQNSVVVEKSYVMVSDNFPDTHCSFLTSSATDNTFVDPSKLSPDINLWREARFIGTLAASDALIEAFGAEGLKFFPSFRATDWADSR